MTLFFNNFIPKFYMFAQRMTNRQKYIKIELLKIKFLHLLVFVMFGYFVISFQTVMLSSLVMNNCLQFNILNKIYLIDLLRTNTINKHIIIFVEFIFLIENYIPLFGLGTVLFFFLNICPYFKILKYLFMYMINMVNPVLNSIKKARDNMFGGRTKYPF